MLLSDADIKNQRELRKTQSDKGIAIEPFDSKSLTPVGYDLRVGKEGFSWNKKRVINIENDGGIDIEPNDTVVIRTLESVSLSKKIGATIHSMATLVTKYSLSHISTTIDPSWHGTLLIALHNYRDQPVRLEIKDRFCTVCFYESASECEVPLGRDSDRDDLWGWFKKIDEEQKRIEEEQKKKDLKKTRKNYLIRLGVIFLIVVLVVGISAVNTAFGTALATIVGAVSPTFNDFLKRR